jgi:hypothetical protein
LLAKCEEVIGLGAHYCSMSQRFIQWEGWHCRPFPETLAEQQMTDQIRSGDVSVGTLLASDIPKRLQDLRSKAADELFARFSAYLKSELSSRVEDVPGQVKGIPSSPSDRMGYWFSHIDRMDIHAMALEAILAGWVRVKGEFCLSSSWITWQYLRLVMVVVYEYWYIRVTSDPRDKWAEHDLADIEYALLLSRADGIITQDKRLSKLASVTFPESDVFPSLDKVPGSYRCDWSGG